MNRKDKYKKRLPKRQKLKFLLITFSAIQFYVLPMEQNFDDIIEKITNTELRNSEQEITSCCLWPSSLEENIQEKDIKKNLIFFELINKSKRNLWISILNGNKFFMPKEITGSLTNLNYSSVAAIITDKSTPLFIYLWIAEPTEPLRKSRVSKPDIIYKINFISKETIFLKWDEILEPQNGGGFFGVNNLSYAAKSLIGYNSTKRTSYALKKNFDIKTNIKKEDIEILKDARKDDFTIGKDDF